MRRTNLIRLLSTAALLVAGSALQLASAAPAGAVPAMSMVTGSSALNSTASKEAAATCTSGRLLGGGGYIEGAARKVTFTRLQPALNTDTFYAAATEMGTYDSNWRVFAYAICGTGPAGLEVVSFQTSVDSSSFKSATAICTGARKVVGIGARVLNGGGQVIIDDLAPNGALTAVTATAYEDDSGFAGNWSLYGYAVCANELPGHTYRTATYTPNDSSDKVIGVSCDGAKVHGVGARMNGAVGEAFYIGMYPSADLLEAAAISLEDHNGYANNWTVSVVVICAT